MMKMRIALGLLAAGLTVATSARAFDGVIPVPVPGVNHIFAPGPRALGLPGLDVNPSSIGEFDGAVALAYMKGHATGTDGQRFDMINDMRIMAGTYLAADGSRHLGAFAFV